MIIKQDKPRCTICGGQKGNVSIYGRGGVKLLCHRDCAGRVDFRYVLWFMRAVGGHNAITNGATDFQIQ